MPEPILLYEIHTATGATLWTDAEDFQPGVEPPEFMVADKPVSILVPTGNWHTAPSAFRAPSDHYEAERVVHAIATGDVRIHWLAPGTVLRVVEHSYYPEA